MTTYGRAAALSGAPSVWWNDVSGWKQQSAFSLHLSVRWPSQSTFMPDVQKKAPLAPQIGTWVPACVLVNVPLDTWLHCWVFASRSAADGLPSSDSTPTRCDRDWT